METPTALWLPERFGPLEPESLRANFLGPTPQDIEKKRLEREMRLSIVLWKKPLITLEYCFMEIMITLNRWLFNLLFFPQSFLASTLLMLVMLGVSYYIETIDEDYMYYAEKKVLWYVYWFMLGSLSSLSLRIKLHTFLLFLGPHIASVTLAAYECNTINFPEPPYPDWIVCPDKESIEESISVWAILSKVRLEGWLWGVGTIIGELPPYFMARGARLTESGADEEEEYDEFEEMLEDCDFPKHVASWTKKAVHNLVKKVGFFGILACASVPNPIFDLAGLACGHFLVPFWTFFGATLIGKGILRMHIQKLFVIMIFRKHIVEQMVALIGNVPSLGPSLQKLFQEYLEVQRLKLHNKSETNNMQESENWLSWIFEKLVVVMLTYFILSLINATAQKFAKRIRRQNFN